MPHIQSQRMKSVNGNPRVWRYMDIMKFVSILNTESLYFCRADAFEDPYEGELPDPDIEALREEYEGLTSKRGGDIYEETIELYQAAKNSTYINCWHQKENQSMAMWSNYSDSSCAIAIKSTHFRLSDSLGDIVYDEIESEDFPHDDSVTGHIDISPVKYQNYEAEGIGDIQSANRIFLYKRDSFDHESEIRALLSVDPEPILNDGDVEYPTGLYVSVDLNKLIEEVVIEPDTSDYIVDSIKYIISNSTIPEDKITISKLDEGPDYFD